MSEENTEKTNLEEVTETKPVKKVTKKKADPQSEFLTNFNWHQYQEGIDELDEKQIKDFDKKNTHLIYTSLTPLIVIYLMGWVWFYTLCKQIYEERITIRYIILDTYNILTQN